MLSDSEHDYVVEELVKWIGARDRPRESLLAPFPATSLQRNLGQGTPLELVMGAVRLCIADGWTHDPPWIVLLLAVVPAPLFTAKLTEIRDKLMVKPVPAADPLRSTLLGSVVPFVNRRSLRDYLPQLASEETAKRPIFVVNGKAKTGKSYSIQYIEHFSYVPPLRIVTYRFVFDPEMGSALGAAEVASQLVAMMGRPTSTMPAADTNRKLHVQKLAGWVLLEAAQSPSMHWFMLDNFRGEALLAETRDFLIALSDRVTTGVQSRNCRLILIGFDRALLTVDAGKVHEETVDVCTDQDIETCVMEVAARAPVALSAAELRPFVLSGLPGREKRMSEVNLRLTALVNATDGVAKVVASIPGADFKPVLFRMLGGLPAGPERLEELARRLEALRESASEEDGQ